MRLSTRQETLNEILDNLSKETKEHKHDCLCMFCDIEKSVKNIYEETKPPNPEIEYSKREWKRQTNDIDYYNNYPLKNLKNLADIKEQVLFIKNKNDNLIVECPFCGPQHVKATTPKSLSSQCADNYYLDKNEYLLDCGHFVLSTNIKPRPIRLYDIINDNNKIDKTDKTAINEFKEWRKNNPFTADPEWCSRYPVQAKILKEIENRERKNNNEI